MSDPENVGNKVCFRNKNAALTQKGGIRNFVFAKVEIGCHPQLKVLRQWPLLIVNLDFMQA
jgi:hypothetical protein